MDYGHAPPINIGHKCAPWMSGTDDGTTGCEMSGNGSVLSSQLCYKTKNVLKRGMLLKSQIGSHKMNLGCF